MHLDLSPSRPIEGLRIALLSQWRHHDALSALLTYMAYAMWQVFASKNIARHRAARCDFYTQMSLVQAAMRKSKRNTRHNQGEALYVIRNLLRYGIITK